MLDFIVSGQVPGTNFVITFTWVVVFGVLFISIAFFRHRQKAHKHLSERIDQALINEISL